MVNFQTIVESQKAFFKTGQTLNLEFRQNQLIKLEEVLRKNEELLYQAIYTDFKKSKFETYLTELSFIYHEIDLAIKKIKKWSKPQKVCVGLVNFPGQSYIQPEPFGVSLIIGAWNYPYQLTIVPLISAIAAGNTCVLKPSELSSEVSKTLTRILNENFQSEFLYSVHGGVEENQQLLSLQFDKIFFTGSTVVGKIVAKAAAEYLTPTTLELGGKSPCLVFSDVDLKIAAQRIAWGKFLNAGQTCIAPDYLLVEESIHDAFLAELKEQIQKIVGSNPLVSESYTRIINQKHTLRLKKLIDPDKIYSGGQVIENENYIEPTILKNISFSDEIMKDEIFGPLLPVIAFKNLDQVLNEIKNRPKPLALYCFTKSQFIQEKVMRETSFGGGAINDVVMHIANPRMPFGGVGSSGQGSYHGEFGFKTFSHFKSILKKNIWFELPFKYSPYTKFKLFVIKLILE